MVKLAIGILLTMSFSTVSWAKKSSGKNKTKIAPSAKNLKLETDVDFSGSTLFGERAKSSEVDADVEADKKLIKVVEPRHDFKFQLDKSKDWN